MRKKLKRLLKKALWKISPRLVLRLLPASKNHFSVGMYCGSSPFDLKQSLHARNPVLSRSNITDAPVGTVADPFMIRVQGTWYMFFEVLNQFNGKGEIALATSQDALAWEYSKIVLTEPFHMSYPQVFEWQEDFYMVPETSRHGSVRLYKADSFPFGWKKVATMLEGERIVDSSIFRFQEMWWLFADSGVAPKNPVLRLYFAEELVGPWREHPNSPILEGDPQRARPAGRVVVINGVPHRFAQSVYPVYGKDVCVFEIVELSVDSYSERQVGDGPIIGPGQEDWNKHGMHHIDLHMLQDESWLACVDGCVRRNFDEGTIGTMKGRQTTN